MDGRRRIGQGTRGRPRSTGEYTCDRCARKCAKIAVHWPDGAICGICHAEAVRRHGQCPGCGVERLLPGLNNDGSPICVECAGIRQRFECTRCGKERARFRRGTCIECALRDDFEALFGATPSPAIRKLVAALMKADRQESIYSWMNGRQASKLLASIADGSLEISHAGLDAAPIGKHVEHLRSILTAEGIIEARDEDLHRFELWNPTKLAGLHPDDYSAVQRFARWHHLRRIRIKSRGNEDTHAAVHSAKQEITAAIKLANWLRSERESSLTELNQHLLDDWLSTGPTTRFTVRTFVIFGVTQKILPAVEAPHRVARSTRRVGNSERINWIARCLSDKTTSTSTRTAALLLLLYAQPITRIAAMKLDAIHDDPTQMTINFSDEPTPVPDPFAHLIREHLGNRARSRTRSAGETNYLFPGMRGGTHLTRTHLMNCLRDFGIDLLGMKNQAIDDLVMEMPAPLVADQLGYSQQITAIHADYVGTKYMHYVANRKMPGWRPGK